MGQAVPGSMCVFQSSTGVPGRLPRWRPAGRGEQFLSGFSRAFLLFESTLRSELAGGRGTITIMIHLSEGDTVFCSAVQVKHSFIWTSPSLGS